MLRQEADRARAAERLFKIREKQKADAPKAIAEYYAAQQAMRDQTAKLKQLRLAREAEKRSEMVS